MCSTQEHLTRHEICSEIFKGKHDCDLDRRITMRVTLTKLGMRTWIGFTWLMTGPKFWFLEHEGNFSGFT